MERQPGTVRQIGRDWAIVAVNAASAGCAACAQRGGCGIGRLARPGGGTVDVRIALGPAHHDPAARQPAASSATGALAVGDPVAVVIDTRQLLPAALLGYLLPTVLLVAGALLGETAGSDGSAVAGALAGLAIGVGLPRLVLPRLSRNLLHLELPPTPQDT